MGQDTELLNRFLIQRT